MTRAEQIEFIKQQTKLAKKVALRPHIAQSEVLAALHELETEEAKPKARIKNKRKYFLRFCDSIFLIHFSADKSGSSRG